MDSLYNRSVTTRDLEPEDGHQAVLMILHDIDFRTQLPRARAQVSGEFGDTIKIVPVQYDKRGWPHVKVLGEKYTMPTSGPLFVLRLGEGKEWRLTVGRWDKQLAKYIRRALNGSLRPTVAG